ncbi:MAG: hypothetical protein KBG28_26540 [Kofleriaceae bacterium]|nr:hypothetical protein [Kofleriaceae bacterium]MBP6837435.1 hypothetical protein [Kofleriaceae bacterium]MBP9207551.1 hypothetical protein [Kofleriaceae bacterium]
MGGERTAGRTHAPTSSIPAQAEASPQQQLAAWQQDARRLLDQLGVAIGAGDRARASRLRTALVAERERGRGLLGKVVLTGLSDRDLATSLVTLRADVELLDQELEANARQLTARPIGPEASSETATAATKERSGAEPTAGDAASYFTLHQDAFLRSVSEAIAQLAPPAGHPRLRWRTHGAALARHVTDSLAASVARDGLEPLLHPADPWATIDAHRDSQPGLIVTRALSWSPAAGHALGTMVLARLRASLPRMAARMVTAHDDLGRRPTAMDLLTSHPFDGVVVDLLVDPAWVDVVERGPRAVDPVQHAGRALTQLEFVGERDRSRWNWIKATIADDRAQPRAATAEDVATALWDSLLEADRPQTYLAYAIRSAPPFFILPEDWAAKVPGMAHLRPTATGLSGMVVAAQTEALARAPGLGMSPAETAEAALAQARPATATAGPELPQAPAALATELAGARASLVTLRAQLGGWLRPGDLAGLDQFLAAREHELTTGAAEGSNDPSRWWMVVAETRQRLRVISGEVLPLVRALPGRPATAASDDPVVATVEAFTRALGAAHLGVVAQEQLDEARRLHGRLDLALLGQAVDGVRADVLALSGLDPRATVPAQAPDLRERMVALEGQRLGAERAAALGQPLAPDQRAEMHLEAKELALQTRLVGIVAHADQLQRHGRGAEDDWGGSPLLALSMRRLGELRHRAHDLSRGLVPAALVAQRLGEGDPLRRDHEVLAQRQANLVDAENGLRQLQAEFDEAFFRTTIEAIEDAQLSAALAALVGQLALLVLVGAAAGMVAGAAARFVVAGLTEVRVGAALARGASALEAAGGAVSSARVAGAITRVTVDAGLNALAQGYLTGQSTARAFAENLLANAAVASVLGPITRRLGAALSPDRLIAAHDLDGAAAAATRLGAGAAVLGVELASAMAVNHVAHRIVALPDEPTEAQLSAWTQQGLALGLGKVVHAQLGVMQERMDALGSHAGGSLARLTRVRAHAHAASRSGDPEQAMAVWVEYQALVRAEHAVWQRLAADPDLARSTKLPPDEATAIAADRADRTGAELAQAESRAGAELLIRSAGLREPIPGSRTFEGSRDQLAILLHHARTAGVPMQHVAERRDATATTLEVQVGAEVFTFRVTHFGAPERAGATPMPPARRKLAATAAQQLAELRQASVDQFVASADAHRVDQLVVGFGFAGVVHGATGHAAGHTFDPRQQLVLYRDDGPMTGRGALPSGQRPHDQDMPGLRVSDHAADPDQYTRSDELGEALAVGRAEAVVPSHRGEVIGVEWSGSAESAGWDQTLGQGAAARALVRTPDGVVRSFYADRMILASGMGPSRLSAAKEAVAAGAAERGQVDADGAFAQLAAGRVLLGGNDVDLGKHLHAGERVLVWGGSPTGAWAAEEATAKGAARTTVVGDAAPSPTGGYQDHDAFYRELETMPAETRAAAVAARIAQTHSGSALPRNQQAGATYDGQPSAIRTVELGRIVAIAARADGRVDVTIAGANARVEVFDRVVVAHGQDLRGRGSAHDLLGTPPPMAAIDPEVYRAMSTEQRAVVDNAYRWLYPVHGGGTLVALATPSGSARLVGAAMATPGMDVFVHPAHRAGYRAELATVAQLGTPTMMGRTIGPDSAGVTTGLQAQGPRVLGANEERAAREYHLPAQGQVSARHLQLPDDPEAWQPAVAQFLERSMKAYEGRLHVEERVDHRGPGVRSYRVTLGGEHVGTLRVYADDDAVARDRQLAARVRTAGLSAAEPRGRLDAPGGEQQLALAGPSRAAGAVDLRATLGELRDLAAVPADKWGKGHTQDSTRLSKQRDKALPGLGRALGQLHAAFRGAMMPDADKAAVAARARVALASALERVDLSASIRQTARARLDAAIEAFLAADVPLTARLGAGLEDIRPLVGTSGSTPVTVTDLAAARASLGPDGTGTHPALDEVAAIEAELRGAGATTSDLAKFRDAYQVATEQSQQPLQGLTESRQVFATLRLPMSDRSALLAELRSLDLIPPGIVEGTAP